MLELISTIFVVVMALYVMALGFAIMLNRKKGIQAVNQFWLRLIALLIGWPIEFLGKVLMSLGKSISRTAKPKKKKNNSGE